MGDQLLILSVNKNTHLRCFYFLVLSPGIEPRSSVPQTDVLSIELREQVAKQYHNSLFFSIVYFGILKGLRIIRYNLSL